MIRTGFFQAGDDTRARGGNSTHGAVVVDRLSIKWLAIQLGREPINLFGVETSLAWTLTHEVLPFTQLELESLYSPCAGELPGYPARRQKCRLFPVV